MCTAIAYKTKDFYFGRTLDNVFSYSEAITIAPRNYPFKFRNIGIRSKNYSIIGMAYVVDDYPLYYDAVNEKGLAMAGLNFVGNAVYSEKVAGKDNVAQFEFIPWILSQCSSVDEAKALLKNINITAAPFNNELPVARLHWMIADCSDAITVEAVREGIRVYPNPVGVLTNNPPFDIQMFTLNNYMHLSAKEPSNTFSDKLPLHHYSRGMGAIGLPGDLSSQSRFVRAAFTKMNSVSKQTETESVSQFFHIMDTVCQTRGSCRADKDEFEITIYTSCCNASKGIYYYTTYGNRRITAVNMHTENLHGNALIRYPLILDEQINFQN